MQKQEIDIDKVIQFMITNGLHRNLASEHPLFTSENNDYLLTLTLYPTNNSKDVELLIKNKFNNRCIEVYLQPCERRVILQNVQLALDKGREKTGFDCFCKDESHKSKTKKVTLNDLFAACDRLMAENPGIRTTISDNFPIRELLKYLD